MRPDPADAAWPVLDDPGELVQRLRNLRWPEASAEARRRCWMQIAPRVDALFRSRPATGRIRDPHLPRR